MGTVRDESFNPYEYDDPTNPPPGYQAIECPHCSLNYMKPSTAPRMSLGPIPGLGTPARRSATLCTVCRGRTWVWSPLAPILPNIGENGQAGGAPHDEG
jgi:hypothetical protein